MTTQELEPPGFQPELLGYLTADELSQTFNRLATATERLPKTRNMGEIIDRLGKTEEERIRLGWVAGTAQVMTVNRVRLTQIEGVHIWSTTITTSFGPELVFKADVTTTRKHPTFRLIPETDRKGLVSFFRTNSSDLPELTRTWFDLPHPLQELHDMPKGEEKQLAATELLVKIQRGEAFSSTPFAHSNLSYSVNAYVVELQRYRRTPERESALAAILFCNRRLEAAQETFSKEDLKAVFYYGYTTRAFLTGFLTEHGGLRYPSRLRLLACLSEAADLERADILFGCVTDRGRTLAECFGSCNMEMLQRRVVEKIFGRPVEVYYGGTLAGEALQPTRRYSIPQIPEIAFMQQQIAASIQDKL